MEVNHSCIYFQFFIYIKKDLRTSMVVQVINPSIQEAEVGEFLWVQGQPELCIAFEASLGYRDPASGKKKKKFWQYYPHLIGKSNL